MITQNITLNIAAAAALCLFATGCNKKTPVAKVPQPTAPVAAATPAPAPAATPAPAAPRPAQQTAAAPATPRYPDAATRARIDELLGRIQDAYFDYDRHTLSDTAVAALSGDSKELSTILAQYPEYKIRVEGYCDERGSTEYNIALGEARAKAAKDYLVSAGVSSGQLSTVSYGKEKPICQEHDEACWSKNRRVHIVALKEGM